MANFVISPIISVLLQKLSTEFWKEVEMIRDVKKDVEKLKSILLAINSVLDDALKKSINGDKAVCEWLKKLKDAAYDADNVLDDFQYEVARRKKEGHDSVAAQVRDLFSSNNPIKFRHKIGKKIKKVIKRLNEIGDEKSKYNLAAASGGAAVPLRPKERETHAGVIESKVYGRDGDKEKVVKFLLDKVNSNGDGIPVLSIVGLGGIGKTTLARLAYNDGRINKNPPLFDLKIWVWVSGEFDVKRITREIIECAEKQKCDDLGMEPLRRLLEEAVGGKKVLLVLDDVWNDEETLEWDELKHLLGCCNNEGSKMIVTTRKENVTRAVGSVVSQHLKTLSFKHCWDLFKERAFGVGKEEETPALVAIGKEIVSKCGGLPLAAKAMGGLMGSKRGEVEWQAVKNSEVWSLSTEILPALMLSYYDLPPDLKQCFSYCALFPKGWEFEKEKMIGLWIGEGFIPSSLEGYTCPEDLGNSYFNILLQRSFFQVPLGYSSQEYYTMHDLMHDVACSVAKDDFSMMPIREEVKPFDNCRYLSLIEDSMSPHTINLSSKLEKLRSLILIQCYLHNVKVNWDVLLQLRNIRVLDLSSDRWRTDYSPRLPDAICKLKHLRLLDLSGSGVTTLPITIGNLYNLSRLILRQCNQLKYLPGTIGHLYNLSALVLQGCYKLRELPDTISRLHNLYTLDMKGCNSLRKLPCGMSKMSSLKNINIDDCGKLMCCPPGIGRFSNLQALPKFVVGEEEGQHITELEHLNEIRGLLCIYQLEKVRNTTEVEKANLAAKIHVKRYELVWSEGREEGTETEDEGIIEWLHPPPNVTDLCISGYGGSMYPSWIMLGTTELLSSWLRNLTDIELSDLKRCERLPPFGQLPSLKRLKISGMDGVRRIGEEFYYGCTNEGGCGIKGALPFPLLEELELKRMHSLEEWVMEAGDIKREMMFPCLTRLDVHKCPKLRVLPGLPVYLTNLTIWGTGVLSARSFAGLSIMTELIINWEALSAYSWREVLQYPTSLESLWILDSEEMDCLPESITQYHIPSLRSLHLGGYKKLTSLADPQQHQHQEPPPLFASLHDLVLTHCGSLTALPEWLGGLTCLRSLRLDDCPKLKRLPDGLQRLNTLDDLYIGYCPRLVGRLLKEDIGEEWHKISHIRRLHIYKLAQLQASGLH